MDIKLRKRAEIIALLIFKKCLLSVVDWNELFLSPQFRLT